MSERSRHMSMAESDDEEATLEWFEQLGYTRLHGTEVSPGGSYASRESYSDVVLGNRLYDAIRYLNPQLSSEAVEEVYRRVTRPTWSSATAPSTNCSLTAYPSRTAAATAPCATNAPASSSSSASIKTTGSSSTSSPLPRSKNAARMSSSSSTACRSSSSNSKIPATKKPRSRARFSSSRPTKRRFPRSSPITKSWSSPMASRRARAQ